MKLPVLKENMNLAAYIVCTVLVTVLSILYARLQKYRAVNELKKRYGCQEATKYRHEDKVMGSDMVRERTKAMKEGRFFRLYGDQFNEYGKTFEEIWRGRPLINTIDTANVQKIAATSFDDYGKDPERSIAQAPFLGPSIFDDGPGWRRARALVKPIFSRAEMSDMEHMESHLDRCMALLPDNGSMVDMQPLLHRLFLDVTMEFLFGKSLGFLNPVVPVEATEFIEAFKKAQIFIATRRDSGWLDFRLARFKKGNKDFEKSYTTVHKFVDEQVARVLRENKPDFESSAGYGKEVKSRYVLLDEMAKHIRDPIQLRYHILGPFFPGRDSTAIAVSNVLFQLARHPHYWTQLREQALKLQDQPLTFEKLKSLVLFKYVLQETIRTIGPVARVWRVALKDTILPHGGGPDQTSPLFVARGTPVVAGTWAMMHNKEIWGDDVEDFKPERWFGRKPMWEFVPFWGGPRICPAQQQVYTYVIYTLVRLTQRFEHIENRDPVLEYVEGLMPSIESVNGVKVAFRNS